MMRRFISIITASALALLPILANAQSFVITASASGGIIPSLGAARAMTGSGDMCAAPCAVYFDAAATTDPNVTHPFHEDDYAWNFGDSNAGTHTFGAANTTDPCGSGLYHLHLSGYISGTTLTALNTVTSTMVDAEWNPTNDLPNQWNNVGLYVGSAGCNSQTSCGDAYGGMYGTSNPGSSDFILGSTTQAGTQVTAQTSPNASSAAVASGSYNQSTNTVTLVLNSTLASMNLGAGMPVTALTNLSTSDATLTAAINNFTQSVDASSSGSTLVFVLTDSASGNPFSNPTVTCTNGCTISASTGSIIGVLGGPGVYTVNNSQTVGSSGSPVTLYAQMPNYCNSIESATASKNAAYGPEAAHVFDFTPGTGTHVYTVSLTVKDASGFSNTTTQSITVYDPNEIWGGTWSGTTCNSRTFGDGVTSSGCTICISRSHTYTNCPVSGSTDAAISNLCAAGTGNCNLSGIINGYMGGTGAGAQGNRLLFRTNEAYDVDATCANPGAGLLSPPNVGMIGSYDTATSTVPPLWTTVADCSAAGSTFVQWFGTSGTEAGDWRITNIHYVSDVHQGQPFSIKQYTHQILMQNVTLSNTESFGPMGAGSGTNGGTQPASQVPFDDVASNWNVPKGDNPDQIFQVNNTRTKWQQLEQSYDTRYAFIDNDFENSTIGDWNLRNQYIIKLVVNHNYLARPFSSTAEYLSHGDPTCHTTADIPVPTCNPYIAGEGVISDNVFQSDNGAALTAIEGGGGVSMVGQTSAVIEPIKDVIYERNRYIFSHTQKTGITQTGWNITNRLNIFDVQAWTGGSHSVTAMLSDLLIGRVAVFNGTISGTALTINSLTSGSMAIGDTVYDCTGTPATCTNSFHTTIASGTFPNFVLTASEGSEGPEQLFSYETNANAFLPPSYNIWDYNNTVYIPFITAQQSVREYKDQAQGGVLTNNLLYAPVASNTTLPLLLPTQVNMTASGTTMTLTANMTASQAPFAIGQYIYYNLYSGVQGTTQILGCETSVGSGSNPIPCASSMPSGTQILVNSTVTIGTAQNVQGGLCSTAQTNLSVPTFGACTIYCSVSTDLPSNCNGNTYSPPTGTITAVTNTPVANLATNPFPTGTGTMTAISDYIPKSATYADGTGATVPVMYDFCRHAFPQGNANPIGAFVAGSSC